MNIFEQISFIYFERDRSEGLKNIFALSLQNYFFSQKKINWKYYISVTKYENMPLLVGGALNSINSFRKNVLYFPLNNNNVSIHTKFHKNALTCHVECTIWLVHGSIRDWVFNIKKNNNFSYFQYKPKKFLRIPFM